MGSSFAFWPNKQLVGDKGYISRGLFEKLLVDGIQILTKLTSNMNGRS